MWIGDALYFASDREGELNILVLSGWPTGRCRR